MQTGNSGYENLESMNFKFIRQKHRIRFLILFGLLFGQFFALSDIVVKSLSNHPTTANIVTGVLILLGIATTSFYGANVLTNLIQQKYGKQNEEIKRISQLFAF